MSTVTDPPESRTDPLPDLAQEPTDPDPGSTDVDRVAEALATQAELRSTELEHARRVPEDLYLGATRSGLFRQLVVEELGGLGRTPLEWFRTGLKMARIDASFAWVVTQGAAELGWIAAGGDDRWARELLGDPLAVSASSSAGIGALRIDGDRSRFGGRWTFNSGAHGATWIGGLGLVDGEVDATGRPVIRWGWVPADRAEIVEDWEPTGLRGTGSHSTTIPEQEIPTSWTFDPHSPTDNDRGPHRCVVGNGNWPIATSVAAIQLGTARRALDEARAVVRDKAPPPDFVPLSSNAAIQRWLVEGEGLWLAARASVERELESMWTEARSRGEVSREQRVRLHSANITANSLAVRIVDDACRATGTAAVPHRSVLGRCRRDAHALEGHIATNGASAEHNARVSLGAAMDQMDSILV